MTETNECELNAKETKFSLEEFLSQDFIPEDLKHELREANVLFLPKIVDEKPLFEIATQDLYNYFKSDTTTELRADTCIGTDDIQYVRKESVLDYIALGWIFVEEFVLRPFIEKIKIFFKKGKKIDLKLSVKKPDKTIEIEYKGKIEHIERILDKVKEL